MKMRYWIVLIPKTESFAYRIHRGRLRPRVPETEFVLARGFPDHGQADRTGAWVMLSAGLAMERANENRADLRKTIGATT